MTPDVLQSNLHLVGLVVAGKVTEDAGCTEDLGV